jgi:hypothetical protein
MTEGFEAPQTGFRAPRVPFDLRCILLGAAGYLVVMLADWILGLLFHVSSPVQGLTAQLVGHLGVFGKSATGPALNWWQFTITLVVWISVWALFGAAILRAAALRLTRDEPLSLKDCLAFGGKNWLCYLRAPVLLALFAVFFILCNMLAGLVMSLWGVGSSILNLVLFPLVLISSLLVTFSVVVGAVAVPLMWAGIAVEQNGALEAVSRAFSYIFARPFRFLFGYALLFLLIAIVVFLAGHFEITVQQSLKAGIVRAELDNLVSYEKAMGDALDAPARDAPHVARWRAGIANIRNIKEAPWYDTLGFAWMWILLSAFLMGFKGYAVYVFFGGTASLYLQLRQEIDGTEETEIYPPLEDEFESGEGVEPRWTGEEPPAEEQEPKAEAAEGDEGEEEGQKDPEPNPGDGS